MKNNIKLYKSITNINDEFIEEAQQQPTVNKTVKKYGWVKYGAAAACLCLAVCTAAIPLGEQPTDESATKQYTMADTSTAPSNTASTQGQQQTVKNGAADSLSSKYTKSAITHKNQPASRYSAIDGKALTTAGAGGIMPGGALWQMSIANSDSQQESKQPALTDAPLIHAKQIDAAPMVYVNDKLYKNYAATESVADIEKDFIYLGNVESYTRNGAADPVPHENFQANIPCIGAEINQYGDDVLIYMEVEDAYYIYKAVETVESTEREHPAITEEAYPSKTITTDNEDIKY